MYEWMVREDGGGWRHWRDRVPTWVYPCDTPRPKFAQLLIPTLDSVRYEHLLRLVFSVGKVLDTCASRAAVCVWNFGTCELAMPDTCRGFQRSKALLRCLPIPANAPNHVQ